MGSFVVGRVGGHKRACLERNRRGISSKWVSFPGLRLDYIHTPSAHERIVLDSGDWKNPVGADFTRLPRNRAYYKRVQKMVLQKVGRRYSDRLRRETPFPGERPSQLVRTTGFLQGSHGAQGGIRTRDTLETIRLSSVVRVTAVHTLGRLPRAADRAILPRRVQTLVGLGAKPGKLPPGQNKDAECFQD